jgi:hypothetical protein
MIHVSNMCQTCVKHAASDVSNLRLAASALLRLAGLQTEMRNWMWVVGTQPLRYFRLDDTQCRDTHHDTHRTYASSWFWWFLCLESGAFHFFLHLTPLWEMQSLMVSDAKVVCHSTELQHLIHLASLALLVPMLTFSLLRGWGDWMWEGMHGTRGLHNTSSLQLKQHIQTIWYTCHQRMNENTGYTQWFWL